MADYFDVIYGKENNRFGLALKTREEARDFAETCRKNGLEADVFEGEILSFGEALVYLRHYLREVV